MFWALGLCSIENRPTIFNTYFLYIKAKGSHDVVDIFYKLYDHCVVFLSLLKISFAQSVGQSMFRNQGETFVLQGQLQH